MITKKNMHLYVPPTEKHLQKSWFSVEASRLFRRRSKIKPWFRAMTPQLFGWH
jgi:hypothetical protein